MSEESFSMTDHKLSQAEVLALWLEAERRLRLVDREPPLTMAKVDGLRQLLGERRADESLADWLLRARNEAREERPSAQIIPFSPRRQRFVPVAEITRLAADSAGGEIGLPVRELETADGRFRLAVTAEGDQLLIKLQALGNAADEFAGRSIGLASAGAGAEPVAVLQLDGDGDGQARLPDSPGLRRALRRPVIGLVEDL
jgi:hypothetical protein